MRLLAAILPILLSPAPSVAQDSLAPGVATSLCFHAKPKPACSAFLFTNAGAYVVLAGMKSSSASRLRAVVDWGFMVNVSPGAAIGASVFASLDEGGPRIGPAARYRRWMSPVASLEFAIGAPLNNPPGHLVGLYPGSIFGLVRWSPARWFAVSPGRSWCGAGCCSAMARTEKSGRGVAHRSGWRPARSRGSPSPLRVLVCTCCTSSLSPAPNVGQRPR